MSTDNGRLSKAPRMDRVTVRLDVPDVAAIERLVDAGAYPNQSVFVRDAVAEKLAREVDA